MKISHTMGSICSNQTKKDLKAPADLSELLQQTEKVSLRVQSQNSLKLNSRLEPPDCPVPTG